MTTLVPIVKSVLAEFVPNVQEAIEMVNGRVCLVDGTITPCWSYDDHDELWSRKHGTTGFNAQLICLLSGDAIYVSDPLPGCTHDARAFTSTPVAEIVGKSGGGIGDKGYQGCDIVTPRKTPPGGELSKADEANNAVISALRAPVERLVAHFKSWRIFHTDYRRPYCTCLVVDTGTDPGGVGTAQRHIVHRFGSGCLGHPPTAGVDRLTAPV